ncbi:MAG: hypothetical protein R3B72_18560 [Polyangiaceae bacterium]
MRALSPALAALLLVVAGGCKDETPDPPRRPAPIPTSGPHQGHIPPKDLAKYQSAAVEGLARQKARLKEKCWEPNDPARSDAGPSKAPLAAASYELKILFDEKGQILSHQVLEEPGKSVPAVAQCLREADIGLSIPAPARKVTVTATLVLP